MRLTTIVGVLGLCVAPSIARADEPARARPTRHYSVVLETVGVGVVALSVAAMVGGTVLMNERPECTNVRWYGYSVMSLCAPPHALAGGVLALVGVGVLPIGIILTAVGAHRVPDTRVTVVPQVGPQSGGATLSVTF